MRTIIIRVVLSCMAAVFMELKPAVRGVTASNHIAFILSPEPANPPSVSILFHSRIPYPKQEIRIKPSVPTNIKRVCRENFCHFPKTKMSDNTAKPRPATINCTEIVNIMSGLST